MKSVFPVIGAHSAGTEPAESHLAGGEMNDSIVDTSAAETALGDYFSGNPIVVCEDV